MEKFIYRYGFLPSALINMWYGGVSAPMLVALILIGIKEKWQ